MLNLKDTELLKTRHVHQDIIMKQVEQIRRGSKNFAVTDPAILGNGIQSLSVAEENHRIHLWEDQKKGISFEKFTPASGAATRMFKDYYSYLSTQTDNPAILELKERIEDFPFFRSYKNIIQPYTPLSNETTKELLNFLLTSKGWGWSKLPKGLIPFHDYQGTSRTALGEHLSEGRFYGADQNQKVHLHFTLSEQHTEAFKNTLLKEAEYFPEYQFVPSFSFQKKETDTIALDENKELFRNSDGSLLFRPGGHGSLIYNLNERERELLFIKNIDNVQKEDLQDQTIRYFKILAGTLLNIREEMMNCLHNWDNWTQKDLHSKLIQWCGIRLSMNKPISKEMCKEWFQRPTRICGMVKNQGEPGGGPFWVKDSPEKESLQILESAQLNLSDPSVKEKLDRSTHFNPVFMVCMKQDLKGQKLDLLKFRDPDSYFITEKTLEGRKLTALEHPGLWNGAMANWNTIFLEIPSECFSPVKVLGDLLRPTHA